MIEIVNAVDELAEKERSEKTKEKGLFVDFHHAYGVIREEIDEALEAADAMAVCFGDYWKNVKSDYARGALTNLADVSNWALNTAAEFIQVSAMCKKAIKSLEKGEGNE